MQTTIQQQAFIQALVHGIENIALVARAGTGKTTTIILGVNAYAAAKPEAEILVCAFNKAIADEVAHKLKQAGHTDWRKVQAGTIHSMGFGLVKFVFKPTVNEYKVRELIRTKNDPLYEQYEAQIAELVRLAKGAGFGFFPDVQIGDARAWYELADHFDVNGLEDTSDMDRVVEAAQTIYRMSLEQTNVVDYDDMILFPLVKNLRVKFTKDLVILDEAQDTSRARQALARKFVKPHTGRMVVVGDDRQAIYGFAGADAAALPNMIENLSAVTLPLTMTWRCPQAVVREAQRLVPDIVAAEGAIEGEVLTLQEMPKDLQTTDAVLCRNTAPLVALAYSLIRAGKACKVEGRSIGEGLAKLAGRWKVTSIDMLLRKLDDYKAREMQKAMAKGQERKMEEIEDRVATLVEICNAVLAQGKHNVTDVQDFIRNLFADGATNVITLATYHRSKGREWQRVYLYEHTKRCPTPYAKQAWQKQQEANLAYVAITRAQQTLAYVG